MAGEALSDDLAGDASSAEALERLRRQVGRGALQSALNALDEARYGDALDLAQAAIARDSGDGQAWRIAAVAHEKLGDYAEALACHEAALARLPDETEIAGDLGRLALRLAMPQIAEKLLRRYLASRPDTPEASLNLAAALRGQQRYAEAVDVLRPLAASHPHNPSLWNALGVILSQQGDANTALTFFNEALVHDPCDGRALYHRANTLADLGDGHGACADCSAALDHGQLGPADAAMVRFALATLQLGLGEIAAGWKGYEERLSPSFPKAPVFDIAAPRRVAGAPLAGRALLLVGEQGLGDEVMFANVVPDVMEALEPGGRLVLAAEPRLAPLFQRSFPSATVIPHQTRTDGMHRVRSVPDLPSGIDEWTPIASLMGELRASADAFPIRERFLTPAEECVRRWANHWSGRDGLKVGILWKSLNAAGDRARQFSPFELWQPVLQTPGAQFINIQYGDCSAELEFARREFGVEISQPEGIDLKDDLDDVAALCCSLDLVIGFANATINLAAACGAPAWLITGPLAWPRLGEDGCPWYPQVRCFTAQITGAWEQVVAEVAEALASEIALATR
jgi:tetratricopeptide (TPR) repeat protein